VLVRERPAVTLHLGGSIEIGLIICVYLIICDACRNMVLCIPTIEIPRVRVTD